MLRTGRKDNGFSLQDGGIFLFVLLLFTFSCGRSLPYAEYVGMSLQEYILYVISDHYYLMYVWFFFLLYWSTKQILPSYILQRIRYKSNRRYRKVYSSVKSMQLLVMILAHILIAAVIGVTRLELRGGLESIKQIAVYDSNLDVLMGYAKLFYNCGTAIFCVAFYWWLGSSFLFRLLFYVHEVWKKKGLYCMLIVTLVSGMFGFMSHVDESMFEVFFFNNYFILHHVLLGVGIFPTGINVCIMWFVPECIERVEKVCVQN